MEKDNKRNQAMGVIMKMFDDRIKDPMEHTFKMGGATHKLTCSSDCMVGHSQHALQAAEAVLEAVRGEDYHQEQAAARLVGLIQARETLTVRFGEIRQSYPDAAEQLYADFPELQPLAETSLSMWDNVNQTN